MKAGLNGKGIWGAAESASQPHGPKHTDGPPKSSSPNQPAIVTTSCTDFETDHQSNQAAGVTYCTPATEEEKPQITLADIQKAFGELKLDPGVLMIEPPDHVTLVNFDTNFYTTTTEPVAKAIDLLGQTVTLEATPSQFTWTFGDGESLTTSIPGAPYPDLDVTHNYLLKGDYLPALSTTYSGRYKIGDGPWLTIPGTVTIEGTGQPLKAITAKPKLVGY